MENIIRTLFKYKFFPRTKNNRSQSNTQALAFGKMSFFLVVNVLFLIALIIHVILIAYSMIYPSVPSVKIYKRSYNEIEFPIRIKICAREDRESDTLRNNITGYERNFKFFLGQSMFNESLFGWSGHTEDGSFLGSAEGK